jgi:hypothetical protein
MPKMGFMFILLFAVPAFAQTTDKTLYAKQFPGTTVAAKVVAAMAHCTPYSTAKCYVVIEPSLAVYPTGEALPAPCAHCNIVDKRFAAALLPLASGNQAGTDTVTGSGTSGYVACWTGTKEIAGNCPNEDGPAGLFIQNHSTGPSALAQTEYTNSNGDPHGAGTWLLTGINSTGFTGAVGTVNEPSMAYWWADLTPGIVASTRHLYLKGGGSDKGAAQMHLTNGSDVYFPYLKAPTGATFNLTVDSSGKMSSTITFYSAAGTVLPTCSSATKGAREIAIDATNPTYHGAYISGGMRWSRLFGQVFRVFKWNNCSS